MQIENDIEVENQCWNDIWNTLLEIYFEIFSCWLSDLTFLLWEQLGPKSTAFSPFGHD
jgi:hypothetical protein